MAQKKRSKRAKKAVKIAQATELQFPLLADGTAGAGQGMVQVDKILSAVNMRLYRQSMVYPVRFTVQAMNTSSVDEYKFYTLPHNWFTLGAVKHAFKNFRYSIQKELVNANVSKWYDFRVENTNLDGDQDNLVSCSFDGDSYNAHELGEYETSKTSIDDGTDQGFHLFGDLANAYNIFDEYAKHVDAGHPADDSVGGVTTTYTNLHDGDASVMGLLQTTGDAPPYPRNLDGGNWADATLVLRHSITIDPASGSVPRSTPFMDAPLGIVFVVREVSGTGTDFSTSEPMLIMTVKGGSYKGTGAVPIFKYPKDLRLASAKSNR